MSKEAVKVKYFSLRGTKAFLNGNTIYHGTKLIQCDQKQKGKHLYHTVEPGDEIKFFFALDDEVVFIEEKEEFWSIDEIKEKEKLINNWI